MPALSDVGATATCAEGPRPSTPAGEPARRRQGPPSARRARSRPNQLQAAEHAWRPVGGRPDPPQNRHCEKQQKEHVLAAHCQRDVPTAHSFAGGLLCPLCQRAGAPLFPLARQCRRSMSKAGDRANGRRLIRLLSAGSIPHDQGSSRGFLCLANERGLSCWHRLQTRHLLQTRYCEGSPPSTPCRPLWTPRS